MTRTRKSQRKLDRKENFFDPNHRDESSAMYLGYFGSLLHMLDSDFQYYQRLVNKYIGARLYEAIDDWYLAPRDPMSSMDIFKRIQRFENSDPHGLGIDNARHIPDSEYAAFLEVSERLSYGYLKHAQYYLRKDQKNAKERGERYHSSHWAPIILTHWDDYSLILH